MRYTGLTTLFAFTFGAFLMATTAGPIDGQDSNPPPPKSSFTEKVTFRYWSEEHKLFRDSAPLGVDARRILDKQTGKVVRFYLSSRGRAESGLPPPKSEIVDADGVTWVITKATSGESRAICDVVKRPAPQPKATKKG